MGHPAKDAAHSLPGPSRQPSQDLEGEASQSVLEEFADASQRTVTSPRAISSSDPLN
jgi:hypothetical protein